MVRLSIIVSSQRIADEPPDRRRVGLFHLRWTLQRSWLLAHRCWGQREDLKEVSIKSDEVLVDEGIAGHDVVIQRDLQKRTDLIVAVVRQAVSVPAQDKKHIEQELMLAQASPEAIAEEAMLNESAAPCNLADPLRAQGTFFHHGAPPCP
jgi:hypothetical protein